MREAKRKRYLGHGETDGVGDALTEGTRGDLNAVKVILGVTRRTVQGETR